MRGNRAVLLGLAIALCSPLLPQVAASSGNAVVHVITDLQSWQTTTTADDTLTHFSKTGYKITLNTATDDVVSDLDIGPCSVDVDRNGHFQVTLQCTEPAQRVAYATGASVALSEVGCPPPPVRRVQPMAFAAYEEAFQANPNPSVTYNHVIYVQSTGIEYRNVTQVSTPGDVFSDPGTSFCIPFTCPNNKIIERTTAKTPDGFKQENVRYFDEC